MIKWVKPSGLEIETNDRKETVEYCVSIGWKRADEVHKPESAAINTDGHPAKRTRRTKAEMEAAKLDNENQ